MSAKQLFQDKERKFQLLFEDHPQPMLVIDPAERKILEADAAAGALYGYTREQFRGMNLDAVVVGEESGQAPGGTTRHRTSSGRTIDVEVSQHAIDFGGHAAELAIVRDVTGRRQLEEQLRQSQKMESVGMLAGGVAHDFNNLLTIISGYSQLIMNALQPGDPNHYSAEQILKKGGRAPPLTQQLLASSRRHDLQPRGLA